MVGQRRARRQRVLDWRQFFDFLRRARTITVVQVIAEEVFVIRVVPRIRLFLGLVFAALFLLRRWLDSLQLLGRNLFEQRVLYDFLVEEVGQLQRRHRQ